MATENNSMYGQTSITRLKGPDQVRKKAGVIFGTNDMSGANHAVFEIIANSIDEAREGYGKKIKVSIKNSGDVEVTDDGRGVPMDWNEVEQKWNWELVFCTLYASGKYDSSNYSESLGTNGLGATATQYASEYMDVYSTRDGKTYYMHFEKGNPVGKLQVTAPIREGSGTKIKFRPDPEVFVGFKGEDLSPEYYVNILRRQAMLHAGLEITFEHESLDNPIVLYYPKGTVEFINTICQKPLLKNTVVFEDTVTTRNDDVVKAEDYQFTERIAFNFSREVSMIELYHDGSLLFEGGSTMDGLKNGMVSAFEKIAKDSGKLRSSDRFLFKDIEGILVCVGDTNAPGHQSFFKNQTKSALMNKNLGREYAQFIYNNIRMWETSDKNTVHKIVDEIIVNKTAREEAEKVSKKVVRSLSTSISGVGNKPKKFVDCRSTLKSEREIWIVEGDSALGSCKLARDPNFQALMPVRGKIMNCLKEDLSRILNSEIIIDLLRVFGCGIEARSKHIENLPEFDLLKLNWGKIIICTDADLDGMQIRCLVITMIYRLCPTLLKSGKVFIAETPLFEIHYKKDTKFAYNEEEKDQILSEYEKAGVKLSQVQVNRSKGLGENDPDMMNISTMNPVSRRLVPVEYPTDDSMVADVFNALLGTDIEARRELIEEYFKITEVDIE